MKKITVIGLGVFLSANCIALTRLDSAQEANRQLSPQITQERPQATGPGKNASQKTPQVTITIPRGG